MPETPSPRRRPTDWVKSITDTVIARARSYRRRPPNTPSHEVTLADLLRPAEPPPGVVPKGAPLLAQDEEIASVYGWANQYTSILSSQYAEGMVWPGYAELSLLAQRGENRVVFEEIAAEMMREWITLKSKAGDKGKADKLKDIDKELIRLKAQQTLLKANEHDGAFGRGHIYLDCCDPEDSDELRQSIGDGSGALSELKISPDNPVKALRTVEPVWTYPTNYNSVNPLRADWYKPETWFVMGKEVHRTRLLTIISREVADILKPAYSFGGLSLTQMLKPDVDNWLRTRQSVADLIHYFSVFVLATDLGVSLQPGGDQLFKRVELFNAMRDNAGLMVINSKTEEKFENVSAPLGTLDQLQAQAQEHMAAKAGIPLIKLLKIQPHGLNASSEFELQSYYDWIMGRNEKVLRDIIQTLINFAQLNLYGEVDDDIGFDFNPLYQLNEKERAEVDQRKAQTDSLYVQDQVVSPDEIRERLSADRNSPFHGLDLDKTPAPQPPDPFGMGGEPGTGGEEKRPGETPGMERPEPRLPPPARLPGLPAIHDDDREAA